MPTITGQDAKTILGVEVDLSDPDAEDYLYIDTALGGIWMCHSRGVWTWGWNYVERAPDDFDTFDRDRTFKTRDEAIDDADRSLRAIMEKAKKALEP